MNHDDETNLKLLIAFASLLQFYDYRHVPLSPVELLDQWFSTCGSDLFGGQMVPSEGSPKIIRNIKYLHSDS